MSHYLESFLSKTLIKAYMLYTLTIVVLCWTLFMNRWRCIKQYIKGVSVAHKNVSVNFTNIAFNSLYLL